MLGSLFAALTVVGTIAASLTVAAVSSAPLAYAATPTQPSSETARSLYMNNWADTAGLWMAPQLAQTDTNTQYGPRLAELHYSPNGPAASSAVNQIKDYTGFFRDETALGPGELAYSTVASSVPTGCAG